MKDVLGNLFKGPIIPFGSLVEYHPITAKDQSRIHQLGKKSCLDCSSDTCTVRGENLEGCRTDRRPCNDTKRDLHRLCRIPRNCLCQ